MVSISQYGEREVKACKAVLLELVHLLGEIKDEMVIIGGWVPTFLLPQSAITVTLEGELPDGGKDKASFKVAGIVPFLVMKGMTMYERMKEKDAYDIFYCVEHFPGGVEGLAAEFK